MRSRTPYSALVWAVEVLGLHAPVLRGDGGQSDRATWARWKRDVVIPTARFVPGKDRSEVVLARDVILSMPVPGSKVEARAGEVQSSVLAAGALSVTLDVEGFTGFAPRRAATT